MKKEIETLENITTVLKLIIWSFSLTTFNCKPTNVPTDDGLSVKFGIVWFCFFFLCKNFWNVVKAKLISIIDTQNPLNLNKKKITTNTKNPINSILLHSGLNPAWYFWLSTRFSWCCNSREIFIIVQENTLKCSRLISS